MPKNDDLLGTVIKNKGGHYCHAIEFNSLDELKNFVEEFVDNHCDEYTVATLRDFFCSIETHYLGDNEEEEEAFNNYPLTKEVNKRLRANGCYF